MSYIEEWAQLQLAERDRRLRELSESGRRIHEFRARHPWIARIWYGKDRRSR